MVSSQINYDPGNKCIPWEGKLRQQIAQTHPYEYRAFRGRPDSFKLPGADTFAGLQNRLVNEFEAIFTTRPNRNILAVSHWVAIKVTLAHYSSTPLPGLSGIPDPENGGFLCSTKRGDDAVIQTGPGGALQPADDAAPCL